MNFRLRLGIATASGTLLAVIFFLTVYLISFSAELYALSAGSMRMNMALSEEILKSSSNPERVRRISALVERGTAKLSGCQDVARGWPAWIIGKVEPIMPLEFCGQITAEKAIAAKLINDFQTGAIDQDSFNSKLIEAIEKAGEAAILFSREVDDFDRKLASIAIPFAGIATILALSVILPVAGQTFRLNREFEAGKLRFKENEELLENAVEGLEQGFALWQRDGTLIYCNEQYRRLNNSISDILFPGLRIEDFLGALIRRRLVPEAQEDPEDWLNWNLRCHYEGCLPYEVIRENGMVLQIHKKLLSNRNTLVFTIDISEQKEQQKEDRDQLKLLENAIDTLLGSFVLWDDQDRLVICNSNFRDENPLIAERLKPGLTYAEYKRAEYETTIENGSEEKREAWLKAQLAAHREGDREYEIQAPDGTWFLVRNKLLPNGFVSYVSTDITILKQAEKILRESDDRLQDFVGAANDWLWEMDENLRLSYFSDNFERASGTTAEELLGKTREETGYVHPTDPEGYEKHLDDLKNHRAFRNYVNPRVDDDGTIRWLSLSGAPVFDENGTFKGYRGTGTDISERIEFERELHQSRELLTDALESISEGFVVFDKDGRLVVCNSTFRNLYGEVGGKLVPGTPFTEMARLQREFGKVTRIFIDGEETDFESWRRLHANLDNLYLGTYEQLLDDGRWIRATNRATASGGRVGIRSDVTAIKKQEEEARRNWNLLRDAIENIPDGFVLFDENDVIHLTNTRYREIYDRVSDVIEPGTSFAEIAEYLIERQQFLSAVVDDQPLDTKEWFVVRQDIMSDYDGRYEQQMHDGRWILATNHTASSGFRVGIRTDITALKNHEQELQDSEAKLLDAIENISEGFVLYDQDGVCQIVNDKYHEFFSKVADVVVPGATYYDMAKAMLERNQVEKFVVDGKDYTTEEYSAYTKRQVASSVNSYDVLLTDGRWLHATNRLTPNGNFVGIRSDITDIKKHEAEIEESRNRFVDAIESISEGFILFDQDGVVQVVNEKYREYFSKIQNAVVPGVTYHDMSKAMLERNQVEKFFVDGIGYTMEEYAERTKREVQKSEGA